MALQADIPSHSSERKVRLATIFMLTVAALMLALQIGALSLRAHHMTMIHWVAIGAGIMVIGTTVVTGPLAIRETHERRQATLGALEARRQVETLFKMADMLQSALGYADSNAVLRATASKLLPGFSGALYVFNNSGDRLELSTSWEPTENGVWADAVSPTQCWALKRGKPHLNQSVAGSLNCEHHDQPGASLEIPMMARGEVYGLLIIQTSVADSEERMRAATPIATALADAMSLALSNIALREKLRTQALRDPLTGLYNRRYMEDVLERYANLAERNSGPLSVIMIDLDRFKKLNDEHGHALGDAVLCEAAAAILGAIRPCDIACRYGGEELVVLLPDCPIGEGAAKAEVLRSRIERLSENHDIPISASFGVATIPETSKSGDVLADADAALYRAKAEGRNRVVTATHRPIRSVPKDPSSAAA